MRKLVLQASTESKKTKVDHLIIFEFLFCFLFYLTYFLFCLPSKQEVNSYKKHCWRHSSSFRARLEEIVALVMIEEPKFISATIFAPNTMSAGWSEAGGCRACHGTDRGVGYNNHQGGLWSLARPSLEVQAQNEVEECVQVARSRRSNDYEGISPWSLLTLLY